MSALAAKDDAPGELLVNHEAEQQVLGGLMANNAVFGRIASYLQPEHFADDRHGEVFKAIKAALEAGTAATPITLATWVKVNGLFKELGGTRYIAQLAVSVVNVSAVEDYARLVLDLYIRRSTIARLRNAIEDVGRADQRERASEILATVATDLDELAATGTVPVSVSIGEAAAGAVEAVTDIVKHGVVPKLVPSGFDDLDRVIDGFDPGSYTIIGARPSVGKTSLAQWMAYEMARGGYGVAFFSIEMSLPRLVERWLAGIAEIPAPAIKTGRLYDGPIRRPLNAAEMQRIEDASDQIASLPISLDASARPSVAEIVAGVRKMRRGKKPVDIVFVDYLGLLRPPQSARSRYEQVTEISGELKAAAKTLNLPFIVLAQLSRANEQREDKRPQLQDLRDSGAIEQDADIIMFLHREHYYLTRSPPKQTAGELDSDFAGRVHMHEAELARHAGRAELNVAKNRNGRLGLVDLAFNDSLTRFSSLARGEQR